VTQDRLDPEKAVDHGVAHHGPPILTPRDEQICLAMAEWIHIARAAKDRMGYGPDWVPSGADICKSRLFWRLRSGKKALKHPPPTAYSCPWYELIDEAERPHWTMELWTQDGIAYVAQCGYKVEQANTDGRPMIVSYGPYRFGVSKGPKDGKDGWWIQLLNPEVR
jgi:hypothetical protein